MANAAQSYANKAQISQAQTSHAQVQAGQVITLSDAQFDEQVLNSDLPVLVDIWAPWCGPCRLVSPVVDAIAKAHQGQLRVAKLNVDDNPETASQYEVRSIPTLLLFQQGELVERLTGAVPYSRLTATVEPHLA